MSKKLDQSLMDAYASIYEARRGHAAGASDLEKQASQLASDVRYKAKGRVKEGTNREELKKVYLGLIQSSPAPNVVKQMAKKKLIGEEAVNEMRFDDGKEGTEKRKEALRKKRGMTKKEMDKHPQFKTEEFAKTGMVKGTGKASGAMKKYLENAKKKKEKVKMEGYMSKDKYTHDTGGFRISQKDADEAKERIKKKTAAKMKKEEFVDEKKLVHGDYGNYVNRQKTEKREERPMTPEQRRLIPEKKAAKDYDGDGKVESGTQEFLGSRDKAIKKAIAKRRGRVKEGFSAWRIDLDFNEQVKK